MIRILELRSTQRDDSSSCLHRSQLSNGDVEESLLGNSRGIYSDDEDDEDLIRDTSRGRNIEYRDDSDEDILPTV